MKLNLVEPSIVLRNVNIRPLRFYLLEIKMVGTTGQERKERLCLRGLKIMGMVNGCLEKNFLILLKGKLVKRCREVIVAPLSGVFIILLILSLREDWFLGIKGWAGSVR
jgi:hypothetical protein